MEMPDNLSNKAQEALGKMKEGFGEATDNEQMQAEGRLDQAKANLSETLGGVVDRAKEAAAGAFNKAADKVDGDPTT